MAGPIPIIAALASSSSSSGTLFAGAAATTGAMAACRTNEACTDAAENLLEGPAQQRLFDRVRRDLGPNMALLVGLATRSVGVRVSGAQGRVMDTGLGVVIGGEDRTPPHIEGDAGGVVTTPADPQPDRVVTEMPEVVAGERGFAPGDPTLLADAGFQRADALPITVHHELVPAESADDAAPPRGDDAHLGLRDALAAYVDSDDDGVHPNLKHLAEQTLRILSQTSYGRTPAEQFSERMRHLTDAADFLNQSGVPLDPFLTRVQDAIEAGVFNAPKSAAALRDQSTSAFQIASWQAALIDAIDRQREFGIISDAEARDQMTTSVVELFERHPTTVTDFRAYRGAFQPSATVYGGHTEGTNRMIAMGLLEHAETVGDPNHRELRAFLGSLTEWPRRMVEAGASEPQATVIRDLYGQEKALQTLLSTEALQGYSTMFHGGNGLDYDAAVAALEARSVAEQLELMDTYAEILTGSMAKERLRERSYGMEDVRGHAAALIERFGDRERNDDHRRAYAQVASNERMLGLRARRLWQRVRG
ncbi:MAG: hypothetical protein AAF654_07925 [Myxococcota bacterium]